MWGLELWKRQNCNPFQYRARVYRDGVWIAKLYKPGTDDVSLVEKDTWREAFDYAVWAVHQARIMGFVPRPVVGRPRVVSRDEPELFIPASDSGAPFLDEPKWLADERLRFQGVIGMPADHAT